MIEELLEIPANFHPETVSSDLHPTAAQFVRPHVTDHACGPVAETMHHPPREDLFPIGFYIP